MNSSLSEFQRVAGRLWMLSGWMNGKFFTQCMAVEGEDIKCLRLENWHLLSWISTSWIKRSSFRFFLLWCGGVGSFLFCFRLAFTLKCSVTLDFAQIMSLRSLMLLKARFVHIVWSMTWYGSIFNDPHLQLLVPEPGWHGFYGDFDFCFRFRLVILHHGLGPHSLDIFSSFRIRSLLNVRPALE